MPRRRAEEPEDGFPNRLSVIEAVSYTVAIAFVLALAAGWFDGMVSWQ